MERQNGATLEMDRRRASFARKFPQTPLSRYLLKHRGIRQVQRIAVRLNRNAYRSTIWS
jgi:hypothetical protein